jgi:transposase-like protein
VLQAVTSGATKKASARAVGIDRKTLYVWRHEDIDFSMDFLEAWKAGKAQREYETHINHYALGRRPPTSKMTRSGPRY